MKKRKFQNIILVFMGILLMGCEYFTPSKSVENVARVNDSYLTKTDLKKMLPANLNPDDSAQLAQNHINRWATKQLLLDGARLNLPLEVQDEFNAMVEEYKQELYTQAYKDMIIASKMDTTITARQIEDYFKENKENFPLKEDLIKFRFIKVPNQYNHISELEDKFKRFDQTDEEEIEDSSFKYEAAILADSIWVQYDVLLDKIKGLDSSSQKQILKKDNYLQLKDSLSTYLIYVKDVRLRNEQAPLSYAQSTIKKIILNKRKLQFAKSFEKEITKDALENNRFEIYK